MLLTRKKLQPSHFPPLQILLPLFNHTLAECESLPSLSSEASATTGISCFIVSPAGFLLDFISFPVIKGFTCAAAVTIGFGQVKVSSRHTHTHPHTHGKADI